jgi:DNA invertase Pin-like site-specific DNA recombinase
MATAILPFPEPHSKPRHIGYARVSTTDQTTKQQQDALESAGCLEIYHESKSGKSAVDRPELQKMLASLQPGDVVTVWKLDRLGRSLSDLLKIIERIYEAGAFFRSLTEGLDTTTAAGRMLSSVVGAFAEFERNLISERTKAGMNRARAEGRSVGRRKTFSRDQERDLAREVDGGVVSMAQLARLKKCSVGTIFNAVQRGRAANEAK